MVERNSKSVRLCPICTSARSTLLANVRDIEYQTSLKDYYYYQCDKCKIVYLNNPPTDELNLIYPKNYYSYLDVNDNISVPRKLVWKVKEFIDLKLLKRLLKRLNVNAPTVLDVGGGSGYLLSLIKKYNPMIRETYIVDFDEGSKNIAERNGHKFVKSTIECATLEKKFNLVLMLNLIEHVADPILVLKKIYSITLPGAVVLIKTPNTASLNFKLFSRSYWGGYHAPRHFVLFNKDNFASVCQKIGFSEIEILPTQGAPQWVASIHGAFHIKKLLERGIFPKQVFGQNIPIFLLVLAACFDVVFGKLFGTDQMFVVLKR